MKTREGGQGLGGGGQKGGIWGISIVLSTIKKNIFNPGGAV